ncbi:MAG: glycosyl transferase family 1 [Candidatus Altiarchaeales archaeon ex4484_96]|nr:MAG: glycosyl transferase family 1 [Candidatus Altiarchaeales archaeon ex4484_96]
MKKRLDDYRDVVLDEVVDLIYEQAHKLSDKHVVHVNSTYEGGGVAEMLKSVVPLLNDAGVKTGWRILFGSYGFYKITKEFHNALQGDELTLSAEKKNRYEELNANNSSFMHLDHDYVIIHDPQPLPLIRFVKKKQPWIWRAHIDLSNPNQSLLSYLKKFIVMYDSIIVSRESYMLPYDMHQAVIHPSIDPLTLKNRDMDEDRVSKLLGDFKITQDKPIISQVSRFDRWKDPNGVIRVYDRVRKKIDCSLVLLGSTAFDDPEGEAIYHDVLNQVNEYEDVHVISQANDNLVNAVQRASSVVLQKSVREGFALTVSEALWKETPVVASNVGGIPLQVKDGFNGYLVEPTDYNKCAERVIKLLSDPRKAHKMGVNGRKYVKDNFLVTRHLLDWIKFLGEI